MNRVNYAISQSMPLAIAGGTFVVLSFEENEFAGLGLIALLMIFVAWLAVFLRNISFSKVREEASKYGRMKLPSATYVGIICFVSLFVFDWLYPFLFKQFGKTRFVYPALLSVLGGLAGVFSGESGDAFEFRTFALLPSFIVIHCLGWFHLNMVNHRIQTNIQLFSKEKDKSHDQG